MSSNTFARELRLAVCLLVAIGAAGQAGAQSVTSRSDVSARGNSRWSLEAGIGFTASPTSFLLSLAAPYKLGDHFSLVPLFQLGVSGDYVIVSPSANIRYSFDLSRSGPEALRKLVPFLEGGLGLTYMNFDPINRDDTQFLMVFAGGVEYEIRRGLSLATTMRFNVMPAALFDNTFLEDNFYYSWDIAAVRYRF